MRKPDGVAISEALGRRQSTSDNLGEIPRPPSGVRRKSMLPNSLARLSDTRSDNESDTGDVDDIDACLTFDNLDSKRAEPSPDSSSSGSTLTEPPSLNSPSRNRDDLERVPTPIPPLHADPHIGESPDNIVTGPHDPVVDEIEVGTPQLAPPPRSSPRKASSAGATQSTRNKARRSSVLPAKTATRAVPTTVTRNRMALAVVPEPNSTTKLALATEVTGKARAGLSSRR